MLYDGVTLTPRRIVEMAAAWIAKDYPSKNCRFFQLLNLCERAMARGERCIRRGDIYRMAQEQGLDITLCQEFRFDNNIWSALSRYMLMFRPHLAGAIHPRKAEIDNVNFVEIWHDSVRPQTFFPCESWQEAKYAYENQDVCA